MAQDDEDIFAMAGQQQAPAGGDDDSDIYEIAGASPPQRGVGESFLARTVGRLPGALDRALGGLPSTAAGVAGAKYLLVTVPDLQTRTVVILVARELNPELKVFARARYLEERAWLEEIGASEVCYEEAEAAIGLSTLLLREVGADEDRIRLEHRRLRSRLAFEAIKPETKS